MESLFGFKEGMIPIDYDDDRGKQSSFGYKLVPWLNWDEWECVRESLLSDSPFKISSALERISTWRSRGCLPIVIDVTAAIIEIQQKDPFYRMDLPCDAILSEQMLAMLYCMAILRLVNCVVEKTRKKTEISIAEAASAIGIPRMLIDIRHEGSHRDLPALPLVRNSAVKAIDWLKSYYWEPQSKQIPFQRDGTLNIRKEIKSKIHELTSGLKVKQNLQPGSKKQITKTLKILVQLYSSSSSEVLSVLLEFLLKALDSLNLAETPTDYHLSQDLHCLLDDWKLVITKFLSKKPDLLLSLLKAVLDLIETQETMKYGMGMHLASLECRRGTGQIEQLSSLFAWLIVRLEGLKPRLREEANTNAKNSPTGMNISNATLIEVLRKCLVVSSYGNVQFINSALHLARLIDGSSLIERLHKLCMLRLSDSTITEANSPVSSCGNLLMQQDECLHEAATKLKWVKLLRKNGNIVKTAVDDVTSSSRWAVAKSWNPCPIGMLPHDLGSSGRLPVLDCGDNNKELADSSEKKHTGELKPCSDTRETSWEIDSSDSPSVVEKTGSKRETRSDIYLLDKLNFKKMKETVESFEADREDVLLAKGIEGCLIIDGVWKKVEEEELLAIKSGVRILI